MAEPRVAVVIVNANGGDHLAIALESLAAQTVPPARVLVVDNASTDGSLSGIAERFPAAEVVRLRENVGFAAANNLAVGRCADCELVALLNPDAFPAPTWLEALVRAAADHPEHAAFASRLVRADDSTRLDGTGDHYHVSGIAWRRDQGSATSVERPLGETFSACAAAALYRRRAFLEVGGFDESFFCYYEDSDLAFRLRLVGYRCLYVPDAVARHVGSATAGVLSAFTVFHSSRNQVWTFVKNMPRRLLWLYLPQHLVLNVMIVGFYAAKGQGRAALAGKRDALRGLSRVRAERRRIQAGRRVDARALRRMMSRGLGEYLRTVRGRRGGARGTSALPAGTSLTRSS